jgi:hypothetical protein
MQFTCNEIKYIARIIDKRSALGALHHLYLAKQSQKANKSVRTHNWSELYTHIVYDPAENTVYTPYTHHIRVYMYGFGQPLHITKHVLNIRAGPCWEPRMTHILLPSLKRSDKMTAGMAAGGWMLHSTR